LAYILEEISVMNGSYNPLEGLTTADVFREVLKEILRDLEVVKLEDSHQDLLVRLVSVARAAL
jgi:hypothetical protein